MASAEPSLVDNLISRLQITLHGDKREILSFKTKQDAKDFVDRELAFWQPIRGAQTIESNYQMLGTF